MKIIPVNSSGLFFLGLCLLVIGMPFSAFLMSVSQLILLAAWIIDGSLIEKVKSFYKNKIAFFAGLVFLIHLAGLLYSQDFKYGLEDIQKKIPLLSFPLIFASTPALQKNKFNNILFLFVLAVFVATILSAYYLLGFSEIKLVDVRGASRFISHIRFSLMICFSVFICFYFLRSSQNKMIVKLLMAIIGFWLLFFLFLMKSITGISIMLFVSLLLGFQTVIQGRKLQTKAIAAILALLIPLGTGIYVFSEMKNYKEVNLIKSKPELTQSKYGEIYQTNRTFSDRENGYLVWQNVAKNELKESWEQRSQLLLEKQDLKGNQLHYTLVRFLASKGLDKDREAVFSLSAKEVGAIEAGIANVEFLEDGIKARIWSLFWELDQYQQGKNMNGHSLTMRFEFWKAAIGIISKNWFLGVGTGDVKQAFALQYEEMDSRLDEIWRLRSHNQFLAILVALGSVGLVFFLISLLYPFVFKQYRSNFLFVAFLLIAGLSMLTEDTLETQAGVTFFSFFFSYLLFLKPIFKEGEIKSEKIKEA